MPLNISDPIYEMLSHARGYAAGDTLVQSISLCIGFWFLDAKTIRKLSAGTVRQQDFEDAICLCLERRSRQAEAAFRGFSQVRLGEHGFQDLFFHWVKFSGDKNRLLRLIERMIYPFLTRASWPYIAVPAWLERLAAPAACAGRRSRLPGKDGSGGFPFGSLPVRSTPDSSTSPCFSPACTVLNLNSTIRTACAMGKRL